MSLPSSSPPDPHPSSTTATTTRLFSNPIRPPLYTIQQQQQPPVYNRSSTRPQLPKTQGIAFSPRGFLPRSVHPQTQPADQTTAGFPPLPAYRRGGIPFGFPAPSQSVNLIRPTHLQHTLLASNAAPAKGISLSGHPKVVPPPPPSSVSDCNGYKDIRDRRRDDSISTVRDRKVKISDDSSLYALCRSWLRNGFPEETQPQYMDGVKSLPRPLPIPAGEEHSPVKKEGGKEEEDEEHVEDLSPQELLQIHIKRAKRVRARLREERLKRIARYKTRLALLLPPIVEQQLRNDMAS